MLLTKLCDNGNGVNDEEDVGSKDDEHKDEDGNKYDHNSDKWLMIIRKWK